MISLKPFSSQTHLALLSRRHLWSLPLVALLGMAAGVLEGAGIGLLIPLLGTVLGTDQGSQGGLVGLLGRFAANLDPQRRMLAVAGAMFGLVMLKNMLQMISHVVVAGVDGRASDDIRRALADRLLVASYSFHLTHDPARLVNVVATESWHASDAIRAEFSRVESGAVACVFIALLFFVNWWLTLIVVVGVVALRFVQARMTRSVATHGAEVAAANHALFERMLASVYHTRVIRLFDRRDEEQRLFDVASDRVRRSMLTVARLTALVWPTLEALRVFLFLGVLVIAVSHGVSFPQLTALLVLLNRLQPHLRAVEDTTTALASATAQVAEVEWLLGVVSDMAMEGMPFGGMKDSIRFEAVDYVYPQRRDAPCLRGLRFEIRAGRSTALIGSSGAGKSTIVNLLCRLLEPTAGAITVDGSPLASLDRRQWLAAIGIAGQDLDLVDGTIDENIRFGRAGLTSAQVESAACRADADTFIRSLPDGYRTRVGENGTSLSGGQRQRIGLARALVRKPSILIFDEATNAVDGPSEATILAELAALPDRPTMLVISHRISTLAYCDDAIVIEDGRVVEQGPMRDTQAYRRLVAHR